MSAVVDYFLHSVDCARHAADVPCTKDCIARLPGTGWNATVSSTYTDGNPHDASYAAMVAARLEYLRGELQAERISYAELAELQSLAPHIAPGDVELLEAAGVPEFAEPECVTCGEGIDPEDMFAELNPRRCSSCQHNATRSGAAS